MPIQSRLIEYKHEDTVLEAYMAWDDAVQQQPGVMVSHAFGGRDEFSVNKARELAALGYVGFALDMYGKGIRGNNREESSRLMSQFTGNRAKLQSRMQAALAVFADQPEVLPGEVAAIGFCFGGMCVLDLARSGAPIKAVVSFHGLLAAPVDLPKPRIQTSVLVLHGHDDPMVSAEDIKQLQNDLTEAGCDWQLYQYGNTLHGFTNPNAQDPDFGVYFSSRTNRRAWRSMLDFLSDTLNR